MKHIGILTAILFTTFFTHAQTDAMLWRISGNGLARPSYVFGTIHLYCNHENISKPEITNAIDSSEVVAMELNLNDFNVFVEMVKASSQPSGKSLKAMMTESEYKLVDEVCTELTGSPLENFDNKKPIMLMSSLISSKEIVGCQMPLPVDLSIADMAKKAKKISYGLESFKFQDSVLNSIPDTTQIKWLLDFCRDVPKAKADLKVMMDAYDTQKSMELYDVIFRISPEMALFNDILLVQRNKKWVEFLKTNMTERPYFMAVGAGHLAGKTGVVNLLKESGYTVTPIIIK